jgi:isoleucyl-tRNA synthetase
MAHGIVLGNDGMKMSKSLRNYPDPYAMFDTYGSDAMRWFLLASPILRGTDLVVHEQGIRDAARHVILPLWNAFSFFTLYANADGYTACYRTDATGVLDRYLLAKAAVLVRDVEAELDAYDLFDACASIREFLDVLTNWYVRRSRNRFWAGTKGAGQDAADAFDTLYTALHVLCRVAAPLLPLVADEIFSALTNGQDVHLTDWPDATSLPADEALATAMDAVRDVCSSALALRKARGLRVRLPLSSLTVASAVALALEPFVELIEDEVNVKHVVLTPDVGEAGRLVLQVVPGKLGPRIGAQVQQVIRAVKGGQWSQQDGIVTVAGVALEPGEFDLRLVPADEDRSASLPGNAGVITLDTVVTAELAAEGVARDLVRLVQQARRDADFAISDRITIRLGLPDRLLPVVQAHESLVAGETLATTVAYVTIAGDTNAELDGEPISLSVEVA